MKNIFVIILCFCFFGWSAWATDLTPTGEIQPHGKTDLCHIAGIDDGDTFDLRCDGWYYTNVRLLWVNAPDFSYQTGGKCYYSQARNYIQDRREKIYKVSFYGNDLCKDAYKGCRNLVQLTDTETDTDLGQMMILQGFAFSWTRFSMIPTELKKNYDRMEEISSIHKIWLWWQCKIDYQNIDGIDVGTPDKMTTTKLYSE